MNPYLESLRLTEISPDEEHWLDERLSELSVKEHFILNGLTVYAPPKSGMELVNLVQNIQDCGICYNVGKEEGLGAFVAREVEGISLEYMSFVDCDRMAEKYMELHPGVFSGGNFIEISEDGLWPYYDGTNLEQLKDEGWSVKLRLGSPYQPDGVWLRLPDYQDANDGKPDEMEITLRALEVKRIDECELYEAKCALPILGDLAEQYDSLADLVYDGQNLGFVLDERGQGMQNFMELYEAALEYEDCGTLAEALDIAESLNRYELVPVSGLREYAETALKKKGVTLSDTAAAAFDYEGFAAQELEGRGYYLREGEKSYVGKKGYAPSREQTAEALPSMVLE